MAHANLDELCLRPQLPDFEALDFLVQGFRRQLVFVWSFMVFILLAQVYRPKT